MQSVGEQRKKDIGIIQMELHFVKKDMNVEVNLNKKMIKRKEFEGEEWFSLESIQETSYEELIEELHK